MAEALGGSCPPRRIWGASWALGGVRGHLPGLTLGHGGSASGVPKVMVSTVASGDTAPYVGPNDICMMYSVTDVAGLNRISRAVLGNGAHALAGMLQGGDPPRGGGPALAGDDHVRGHHPAWTGSAGLERTGTSPWCSTPPARGQSLREAHRWGWCDVIDVTTTEIADLHGGVMGAGEDPDGIGDPRPNPLRGLRGGPGHGELRGASLGAGEVPGTGSSTSTTFE